jgi:hypothetical protein
MGTLAAIGPRVAGPGPGLAPALWRDGSPPSAPRPCRGVASGPARSARAGAMG